MHVLLYDDLGRLTLRRLRPWYWVLARSRAAQLDHELADGMNPETSATLACLFEQQRCSIASVSEFRGRTYSELKFDSGVCKATAHAHAEEEMCDCKQYVSDGEENRQPHARMCSARDPADVPLTSAGTWLRASGASIG